MQARNTIALSSSRRFGYSLLKSGMFALLLWAASAAGAIPIPGTPVPITLQTFVVMLAALTLNWKEAAGAVSAYLVAGALGAPVFAGGTSTMALVGPSAGFLIGFLPGVVIAALLKGKADTNGFAGYARTAARYMLALIVGCIVVVYAFGFLIQSAVTGVPLGVVAMASMGFVLGDLIKALVASLAVSGLAKLF
ncbi:biotin transporter BioY [Bifidobacterium tibiigranuli]|jgi:biotin transport system substrate-specific component|uniref:Biotin transporter n=1 Tax=Bifidobacterium tibiigranuli TaxID=2172043 RepID=A0A5N6RZH7_9BIFI|nr:biotin transporter BioY [Bifidobacterium tibiigranuli]KAE8126718.1 biotin transporter BioY [Bifidobacterium tibiigranuli]KAE8126801.1 biotin transporter BioY [Bifidobacterium tibiigranuli]MCH3975943.1 biotin transporter BioY [Bifidobacterium tibiigranuli]MCH4204420.1 biotin transporter BioY [Bifidobacterium tibiigranuli]MCH4275059.1 biotin transporter BioY [Bifidobacterium tibiigranuli]